MVNLLSLIANIFCIISILIIFYGALIAIVQFIHNEIKQDSIVVCRIKKVRATLVSYMLLGLEVLIVASILKAILSPGNQELIILGSFVAIRTVLSFFLNCETKGFLTSKSGKGLINEPMTTTVKTEKVTQEEPTQPTKDEQKP